MRPGSPFYHFRSKQELLKAAMVEGLDSGRLRLLAAVDGVADPDMRLRLLIRTHLGNLLEDDCRSPMLIYESRALDAADRAEVAAAFDRYQAPWQTALDELAAAGRLASAAPPVRLFLFGMLNGCSHWYRPGGALSVDEVAAAAMVLLLGPQAPLQASPDS
jgi:AcrR family transcriptional regulator